MSQTTSHALLLLDAQRHQFETSTVETSTVETIAAENSTIPHRLAVWREAVAQARRGGVLVVFLQRDGEAGGGLEPLTRGWTLHPDFRVEDGDVLLRVSSEDAFAGGALNLELRSRGVTDLSVLGVSGHEAATERGAHLAGFGVMAWPSEAVS
ncbi:isochorismatase family protein [Deinococcus sp.]|uniref:isochorismatase family protein n=1 Tax=Deinococcus sp. TaxID=47478 RepID=UPI0025CF1AAD|nr:isochorismatase family protein [Deinococcus sp.]